MVLPAGAVASKRPVEHGTADDPAAKRQKVGEFRWIFRRVWRVFWCYKNVGTLFSTLDTIWKYDNTIWNLRIHLMFRGLYLTLDIQSHRK